MGSSPRPGWRFLDDPSLKVSVMDVMISGVPEMLDSGLSMGVSGCSINDFVIPDLLTQPTPRRPDPGPTEPVYVLGVRIFSTRST